MLTQRMQRLIEMVKDLPPAEQDRVAAPLQVVLQQPSIESETVRPDVMDAFERAMADSTDVLDHLRDK
ncbi:MAG TPA: hypothetical protein VF120_09095 [Ktedonobacterales bacterium]